MLETQCQQNVHGGTGTDLSKRKNVVGTNKKSKEKLIETCVEMINKTFVEMYDPKSSKETHVTFKNRTLTIFVFCTFTLSSTSLQ